MFQQIHFHVATLTTYAKGITVLIYLTAHEQRRLLVSKVKAQAGWHRDQINIKKWEYNALYQTAVVTREHTSHIPKHPSEKNVTFQKQF